MAAREPTFLARENYRLRRLGDAAKLVPLLGLVLLLVPILWAADFATSNAMIYVFSVWALLILTIGFLSRLLARSAPGDDAPDDADPPER